MPIAAQAVFPAGSFGELDRYLDSNDAPANCMQLPELDGFLAGIAVSPDPVTPHEWLPTVWGEETPNFVDDREAEAIVGAIMARYRLIADQISDGSFQPELPNTDLRMLIASTWAQGFELAMALRPFEWGKLTKSSAGMLLVPILLLSTCENEEGPLSELSRAEQADALQGAFDSLPECVIGINGYWQMSAAEKRSFGAAISAGLNVGRNDPCPCGSGKKFKKCCGAAA